MITALRVFWRLLFYRPLILVLLVLVYAVAALLLVTVDSNKSGMAVAVMAAFAAAGLSAVLTERIKRYSLQAGVLGLPDHTRMMQRVQGWFLVIFVGFPAAVAALLGAQPLMAIAALSVASGVGILLAAYGGVWIILVLVLGRVLPLAKWASEPIIQALAAAGSVYLIWRWFDLPAKGERAGAVALSRLADARHEKPGRVMRKHGSLSQGKPADAIASALPNPRVARDPGANKRVADLLALGLGYSVGTNWRGALYGIGIAVAALAGWQLLHRSAPNPVGYTCVTAVCCFGIVGNLQRVLRRWMWTTAEQAVLWLTPGWPRSPLVKRALIFSTLSVQRGSILVWASASGVAVVLGWIDAHAFCVSALAILATSLAFTGAAWAVLAQRRIRESNPATILSVLMVGVGAVVILSSSRGVGNGLAIGVLMMTTPPVLALAWYLLAPLRFPLTVDPRALKSQI